MAEAVPARIARKSVGELRHHVEIPQQDPVHPPAGGDQLRAALGKDDAIDQGVDSRVLDAWSVAAAGTIGRRGAEKVALFIARRERLTPYHRGKIEVEIAKTILILNVIDGANAGIDAKPLQ